MVYAPSPTLLRTASRSAWKHPAPPSEDIVSSAYAATNDPATPGNVYDTEIYQGSQFRSFAPEVTPVRPAAEYITPTSAVPQPRLTGLSPSGSPQQRRLVLPISASGASTQPSPTNPLLSLAQRQGTRPAARHTMGVGSSYAQPSSQVRYSQAPLAQNVYYGAQTGGSGVRPVLGHRASYGTTSTLQPTAYRAGTYTRGAATYGSGLSSAARGVTYGAAPAATSYVTRGPATSDITTYNGAPGRSAAYESGAPVYASNSNVGTYVAGRQPGQQLVRTQTLNDVSAGQTLNERWQERRVKVPRRIIHEEIVEDEEVIREKIVEVARPVLEEKIVEVPEYQYVEKIVKVPEPVYQERIVQGPEVRVEQRPVPVVKPVYHERPIDVPVTEFREIPVRQEIQMPVTVEKEVKICENPVPQYVDAPVDIVTRVDKPFDVEVIHPQPFEVRTTLHQRVPRVEASKAANVREYNLYVPRVHEVPVNRHMLSEATAKQIEHERERLFAALQHGVTPESLARELELHQTENRMEDVIAETRDYGRSNLIKNYPQMRRGAASRRGASPRRGLKLPTCCTSTPRTPSGRSRRRRYDKVSPVARQKLRSGRLNALAQPLMDLLFGRSTTAPSDEDSEPSPHLCPYHAGYSTAPIAERGDLIPPDDSTWHYIVKDHADFYAF